MLETSEPPDIENGSSPDAKDETMTDISSKYLESENFCRALNYGEDDNIFDQPETPEENLETDSNSLMEAEADSGFNNLKEQSKKNFYVDEDDEDIINIIFD